MCEIKAFLPEYFWSLIFMWYMKYPAVQGFGLLRTDIISLCAILASADRKLQSLLQIQILLIRCVCTMHIAHFIGFCLKWTCNTCIYRYKEMLLSLSILFLPISFIAYLSICQLFITIRRKIQFFFKGRLKISNVCFPCDFRFLINTSLKWHTGIV